MKASHAEFERDQDGGAFCCAHVPRRRPAAVASSFTSLRRTPHRPDPAPPWRLTTRTTTVLPRASGGRRSEVKEEAGRSPAGGHERRRPPDALGTLDLCMRSGTSKPVSWGRGWRMAQWITEVNSSVAPNTPFGLSLSLRPVL